MQQKARDKIASRFLFHTTRVEAVEHNAFCTLDKELIPVIVAEPFHESLGVRGDGMEV